MINNYKEKYLKYKQKYINLKNNLKNNFKNNLKGGSCEKCPIWGFQQHYGECWHDSISTIIIFSDGICDSVQQVFKNNIEDIIVQINKNIDENKIPNYYLPFNIESTDKDFFKKEVNQYVRQLYFRYHNESKNIISPTKYSLLEPVQRQLYRQPSVECSLESVKNLFNIHNKNNTFPKIYDDIMHGGGLLFNYIIISIINYVFMNYNRSENKLENEYLIPITLHLDLHKIFDMTLNIDILNRVYLKDVSINNVSVEIYHRGFEKFIEQLNNLIKLLESDNVIGIGISLSENLSKKSHAQAFIKCSGIYYFYDDNGIDQFEVELHGYKKDGKLVKTFVEFDWKTYLIYKFKDIIQLIQEEIYTYITKSEELNYKIILDKFINITNIISDFFYDHSSEEETYGIKTLKNMFIYNLKFIIKQKEEDDENIFYKKHIYLLKEYLNFDNDKLKKILLNEINFNEKYYYLKNIIDNHNYNLLYLILEKDIYKNLLNIIIDNKNIFCYIITYDILSDHYYLNNDTYIQQLLNLLIYY